MMKKNIRYVAFLRGINVGGHALIKMADLKKAFAEMGFKNVRTLLASGNVLFDSGQTDKKMIAEKMGAGLRKLLKKEVGVALRSRDDLETLRSTDPFNGIEVTPGIRLYVTFRCERSGPCAISIPYATPQGEMRILRATPTEVFSVLDLAGGKGTPEAMSIIEKEFGTNVTTRNWNTILKALS
ncbi:MAG TPA: DUF1697 domain-containing protein [Acidobacteriota bacterium]